MRTNLVATRMRGRESDPESQNYPFLLLKVPGSAGTRCGCLGSYKTQYIHIHIYIIYIYIYIEYMERERERGRVGTKSLIRTIWNVIRARQ